jgi:hypothetical protein
MAKSVHAMRLWSRFCVAIVAVSAALALTSCATALQPTRFDLEVRNYCGGSNTTVSVFTNDVYRGTVYFSGTFEVLRGPLALRAIGTGAYGAVFENSIFVASDIVWELCP